MKFLILVFLSFGSSIAYGTSIDVLLTQSNGALTVEQIATIRSDFQFLAKIRGGRSSQLHDQLFATNGSLDGSKYIDFFESRVSNIGLSASHHKAVIGVYVSGYMWFTPTYFTASTIERVSVLMHEAAHENFGSHAQCPTPFLDENGQDIVSLPSNLKLEGERACADRIQDAYVYHFVFLKNVADHCENCDKSVRVAANSKAEKLFDRFSRILKTTLRQDQ